jgi:hypothetical protein
VNKREQKVVAREEHHKIVAQYETCSVKEVRPESVLTEYVLIIEVNFVLDL